MENMPWLFSAFSIGWGLIFAYLVWISNRERDVRKKLAALQLMIEDREKS